jgi:CTD small phosphatase-like protein 2
MDNGIPIESWYSNPEDVELERLEKYLQELVKFDDVRSELQRKYRIRDQVEGRALVTTEQLKQYF